VSKPSEEISELLYGNEVARLELELEKARNRANAKATALRHAVRELEQLQQALGVQEGLLTATPNPPKWLQPGKGKASKRATVCTMLSDTHFDEVVNPDEVNSSTPITGRSPPPGFVAISIESSASLGITSPDPSTLVSLSSWAAT